MLLDKMHSPKNVFHILYEWTTILKPSNYLTVDMSDGTVTQQRIQTLALDAGPFIIVF